MAAIGVLCRSTPKSKSTFTHPITNDRLCDQRYLIFGGSTGMGIFAYWHRTHIALCRTLHALRQDSLTCWAMSKEWIPRSRGFFLDTQGSDVRARLGLKAVA